MQRAKAAAAAVAAAVAAAIDANGNNNKVGRTTDIADSDSDSKHSLIFLWSISEFFQIFHTNL